MYQKIISGQYNIPKFLSDEAKDIIKKILEVDPKKRLNFEEIKQHPWFNIIDKKYMMYKGIDIDADIIPIDEDIVEQMEKMGINKRGKREGKRNRRGKKEGKREGERKRNKRVKREGKREGKREWKREGERKRNKRGKREWKREGERKRNRRGKREWKKSFYIKW